MTTVVAPTTSTLSVPGAVLTYDVRPAAVAGDPTVLFLIGSPMGAGGFPSLAGYFTDRTVVTYDPRGVERSTKDDPTSQSTPEQHADDLHRIIEALGRGPVDLFASSGGAINALALVAAHPDDVRTLIAHEPPLLSLLPDREHALALGQAISDTYQQRGWGYGLAHFIAVTGHRGSIDAAVVAQPGPDPSMFGLPTEDDGSRSDPLLGQNLLTSTSFEPDFSALRAASTRMVLGVGADSDGQLAARGGAAVAERLGTTTVTFPGGHSGFLGGEYGQTGEPEAFALTLREVLARS